MGQKVLPPGFRVGVVQDWRSHWYAREKRLYASNVVQDFRIRDFIRKKYAYAGIARVEVERPGRGKDLGIVIHVARPGLIIGRRGAELANMEADLQRMTDQTVDIRVKEVSAPALDAYLVAEGIAGQLRKRSSFKRTMKRAVELARQAGAEGVKVQLSGRLGGSEMARREHLISGKLPLQTIIADIDFGFTEAPTSQGNIGVKVWIYKGDIVPRE